MIQIHCPAEQLAAGGPPFEGETIPFPDGGPNEDRAPVTVMADGERWVVVDHEGRVYAESFDPAELASYMVQYLVALSNEITSMNVSL